MKILKLMLAVATVLGFNACASDDSDLDEEAQFLSVGTVAPDFTFETLDDYNGMKLSSFQGSYVVIEFWRSSCPDCRAVTNDVKALYADYQPRGVVFIGVSRDKDKDQWQSYYTQNGMSWIQHYEGDLGTSSSLKSRYNISWVPTFYLIDKEGKVLYATCYVSRLREALLEINN